MDFRRLACVLSCVLLLAFGSSVGLVGAAMPQSGPPSAAATQTDSNATPAPQTTVLEVALHESGDATWVIEHRTALTTSARQQSFTDLQTDIDQNRSEYREEFRTSMATTVAAAANQTGRAMAVTNVTVTTTTHDFGSPYGVVRYQFDWTNFAAVQNQSLQVGDAIAGVFLDDTTKLVLSWPASYHTTTVTPTPDTQTDHQLVWTGPTEFTTTQPTITLAPVTDAAPTEPVGEYPQSAGALPIAIATVLLLLVSVGLWLLLQFSDGPRADGTVPPRLAADTAPDGSPEAGDATSSTAADASDGTGASGTATVEPTAVPDDTAGGASSPDDDSAAAASGASAPDTDGDADADADAGMVLDIDQDLLTNAEQVLAVLEAHDGRVRQQEVKDQLEWSESKTSQVVNEMKDDDALDVFRLGRENVLVDPENDEFPPSSP